MKHIKSHNCSDELRKEKLRATPARLGVLAALEHSEKPLDVHAIIFYLAKHEISVDRVTVFRIVNALTRKGIIRPIQFNDGKLRYEHNLTLDHHHFVCEKCGDIQDVPECNVDVLITYLEKRKGVLVNHHSLEFFGVCMNCKNKI